MAEKKSQSEKRKAARAASWNRGEKRHQVNREDNNLAAAENRALLLNTTPVVLASVQTTYGPTTNQYGKRKRPSKILRAVRRLADPKVAERRVAHRQAS